MPLLSSPHIVVVNSAGQPYALAKMYTYRAGTTTNLATYTTAALSTPHANPVVADANGLFPVIYIDPNGGYDLRIIVKDADDVAISDWDIDNIPRADVGAAHLLPVTDDLYTLGSSTYRWKTITVSDALKIKNNSFIATIQNASLTADRTFTIPDTDAQFGVSAINTQNANYTLVISDQGKTIYHSNSTAYAYTIPTNASVAFPTGTLIDIDNGGSGAITVTPSGGVSLYTVGDSVSGSFILPGYKRLTLKKVATNTWHALDSTAVAPLAAYKTANTARTSTTTLANDPHLSISIPAAGGVYKVEARIDFYGSVTGTQGIKLNINYSGGLSTNARILWTGYVNGAAYAAVTTTIETAVTTASLTITDISTTANADGLLAIGYVNIATAGTLAVSWSQEASDANATNMNSYSYLIATKIS